SEVGSPPGVQVTASVRHDGRYLEVSTPGEDLAEATEVANRVAQTLLARDLEDRRELTRRALAQADAEATQASSPARANQGAIELLHPQGLASDAPVTTRALAALSIDAEARVRDDAALVAEQEAEVLGLATEVRLKRDQLLDESAAARKLLDKG